MTRLQLRCSPDQKERWMVAAGGDGNLSEWIRDVLDREAAAVEEEPVGTSGDAEPDPPLPGEPDGSSSTLTEEGGVNQSSSGDHGQEMSPLPSGENDRSSRTSASTSPPAVSAAVPAPIAAASLDIVVQRLFPGVKTEDLMAEYESTEHDFNDFLSWLPWRYEREEATDANRMHDLRKTVMVEQRIPNPYPEGFTPTVEFERPDVDLFESSEPVAPTGGASTSSGERDGWSPGPDPGSDPFDDTNPEPEDPVDLEPPRMLEAEQNQRPTLSPVCVNAAMHWKLVAGETCRYCGGTL